MVYILLNIRTGETAVLGLNSCCTLGRSRLNNIMLKDQSCSHKHAIIKIQNGDATIMDVGSKRGTYVNKKKVYEETKLANGDVLRFGLYNCKYRFFDPKFHTLVDNSVSGNKEIAFKETLKALKVTLSESYTKECTHYTTEFINLDTLKRTQILDTLIDQKPPVTVKFWIDMIKNIQEVREIPNIYRCMPDIESTLRDKGVDIIIAKKKRHILFKNKLCVFFDVTLENSMRNLILKCGGDTIQHNNQANFAITLIEEREFNEAVVITQSQQEEPSLTVTYFVDKLRQNDKIVHEMYEEEVYISILKGYLGSKSDNEESEDSLQIIQPVEGGDPIVIQDDSYDESGTSSNKKRNKKSGWTTLSRWITPVKKRKADRNQGEAAPAKNSDKFDLSLDMSSDDSNNGQNKMVATKEKHSENEQCKNSEFALNLVVSSDNSSDILITRKKHHKNHIYTDDSETEEMPKLNKTPERPKQKKNGPLPTEIVVADDTEGKEMNSESTDRLNSSAGHNRAEKSGTNRKYEERLEQIGTIRPASIYTDDFETEEMPKAVEAPERREQKKRGHLPTEIIVEDTEDKEINPELKAHLNSSGGHDGTERSGTSKKHKEHLKQIEVTHAAFLDSIYTDDSETEEMPKVTETPERREQKRRGHLPTEIIVEDTEDKEINPELKDCLKSSGGHDGSGTSKKHKEHLEEIRPTRSDPIYTDDSETEEMPKRIRAPERRKEKRNEHFPTEIVVVEDSEGEEINRELKDHLNCSGSHDQTDRSDISKKHRVHSRQFQDIQDSASLPINSDDSEVEEIPQVTKTSRKRKPGKKGQPSAQIENGSNKGLHPELQEHLNFPRSRDKAEKRGSSSRQKQPLEQSNTNNNDIVRKSKIKRRKAEPSAISKSRLGDKNEMLKVNPFARLKNTSTPETTENKNATTNVQRLNKLFKDVEFVPL